MMFFFSYFLFQEIVFDPPCQLYRQETICINGQIIFSGKNKKNISKCRLLKVLPSRFLHINLNDYFHDLCEGIG